MMKGRRYDKLKCRPSSVTATTSRSRSVVVALVFMVLAMTVRQSQSHAPFSHGAAFLQCRPSPNLSQTHLCSGSSQLGRRKKRQRSPLSDNQQKERMGLIPVERMTMGTCLGAAPQDDTDTDTDMDDDDEKDIDIDIDSNKNNLEDDYGSWGESFVTGKEDQDDSESKWSPWLPLTTSTGGSDTTDDTTTSTVTSTAAATTATATATDDTGAQLRETHRRLEEQDKKIDLLIQLVQQQQQQQQNAPPVTPTTSTSTDLPPSISPLPSLSVSSSSPATISRNAAARSHGAQIVSSVQQQPVNFSDFTSPATTSTSPTSPTSSSSLSTTSSTPIITTTPVAPLKVMVFIDGTWLYYSIHERKKEECPIIRRFGTFWQTKYRIDWSALPQILCESLQDTLNIKNAAQSARPAEIVRASVFTSYKADTSPNSWRFKMYEDMKAANYDVHMMETVGKSEKCIDIQLAVEMMHYATVPGAFDVALLLTGDKDFMPAMIRTRQKGRKVGLVSMRRGCNRALYETPGLIDYNVVWLEEHLDRLVVPREELEMSPISTSKVSMFTFMKTINDFVNESGFDRVSSRDLGRYLKSLLIAGQSVLDILKEAYGGRGGGLSQFLIDAGVYIVDTRDDELSRTDPTDRAYWVRLGRDANDRLMKEAKKSTKSPDEKTFFNKYSLQPLEDKQNAYAHTILIHDTVNGIAPSPSIVEMKIPRKYTGPSPIHKGPVSMFTLIKTINDFVGESGFERVSSRDLGRYLKSQEIGGQAVLDIIKDAYGASGGLSQFLADAGVYAVESRSDKMYHADSSDRAYWVRCRVNADDRLTEEAKTTTFTLDEEVFFDNYSLKPLEDKPTAYKHTTRIHESENIVSPSQKMKVSTITLAKLIDDFIAESGFEKVSSRDLGKYLKSLQIGEHSILEEIKRQHGPLMQVLRDSGRYDLDSQEGNSVELLVGRRSGVDVISLDQVKRAISNSDEKAFIEKYSLETLKTKTVYWHTTALNVLEIRKPLPQETDDVLELPEELVKDYSACTVFELKECCRERGLAVSGVKAFLLDRIQKDSKAQITRFEVDFYTKQRTQLQSQKHSTSKEADRSVDLVIEYLRASGGKAGSVSVGRYLVANHALQEVKASYGSLSAFVDHYSDTFELFDSGDESYDYQIVLRKEVTARV